jgi:hypothetical protein
MVPAELAAEQQLVFTLEDEAEPVLGGNLQRAGHPCGGGCVVPVARHRTAAGMGRAADVALVDHCGSERGAATRRRTRPERSLARNEALTAYLFISPYLIIAGIFTLGLLAYAFYISLTDLKATFARTSHFIGLANYLRALRDGDFQLSLINVFWYWVVVTTRMLILTWSSSSAAQRRIRRSKRYSCSGATIWTHET